MKQRNVHNKLNNEKSPYLLQHADNPVNWRPWGKEAFDLARIDDKPVFLSIGYSTCHWCHVMERESFEDSETAAILNETCVPVKVDREEHPAVDQLYMDMAVHSGWGGGWPLSMWLTPEGKPFFGGTYFPPEPRGTMPGFKEVLAAINTAWREKREQLLKHAQIITDQIQNADKSSRAGEIPASQPLDTAFKLIHDVYDEEYGGFGQTPKFPMPVYHSFLLRYDRFNDGSDARSLSLSTLDRMAEGGIYDHIGGGFHRYATDRAWNIPHFEKMLYDNAQLAVTYLEAWQLTGGKHYKRITEEILTYVIREMTSPEGGFYSAQDADSIIPGTGEKAEGAYYVWTEAEINRCIPPEYQELFSTCYGVSPRGNVSVDPHGTFAGKNILYRAQTPESAAKQFNRSKEEVVRILEQCRQVLFKERNKRTPPALDDKIIVSWNALMISAFARAGTVFENRTYIEQAEQAAQFLLKELCDESTKELKRYRRSETAEAPAICEDYVFLCRAFLDLYQATLDPAWIEHAQALDAKANVDFFDASKGKYYMTSAKEKEPLIQRPLCGADSVIPSAGGIGLLNQLRLHSLTGDTAYFKQAERMLSGHAEELKRMPSGYLQLLCGLSQYLAGPTHIIIAGDLSSEQTQKFLRIIHEKYLPNATVAVIDPEKRKGAAEFPPFAREFTAIDDKPAVYLCSDFSCKSPTTDPDKLRKMLDAITLNRVNRKSG